MMRKRIFVLMAFVLLTALFSVPLKAQGDGFFSNYSIGERASETPNGTGGNATLNPMANEVIVNTPLGSGLLILVVGGLGYAMLNNNRKEE